MSYEAFKRLLGQTKTNEISVVGKLFCGSAAGLTASALIYPLKTIKVSRRRKTMTDSTSISFWCLDPLNDPNNQPVSIDCGLRHENLSFWRFIGLLQRYCYLKTNDRWYLLQWVLFESGLVPSVLAIFPASGIDLALYETLKRRVESHHHRPTSPIEKLLIGNLSNGISQVFIYPLLTVRTRLQSNVNQSDTMTSILKRLWSNHGLKGLYNGFSLHMLRLGPASGISFLTFEYVSQLLGTKALWSSVNPNRSIVFSSTRWKAQKTVDCLVHLAEEGKSRARRIFRTSVVSKRRFLFVVVSLGLKFVSLKSRFETWKEFLSVAEVKRRRKKERSLESTAIGRAWIVWLFSSRNLSQRELTSIFRSVKSLMRKTLV